MPGKSCTINLIVNGQRWLEAGDSLVAEGVAGKPWTLAGLQDYVQLTVGSARSSRTIQPLSMKRWRSFSRR